MMNTYITYTFLSTTSNQPTNYYICFLFSSTYITDRNEFRIYFITTEVILV